MTRYFEIGLTIIAFHTDRAGVVVDAEGLVSGARGWMVRLAWVVFEHLRMHKNSYHVKPGQNGLPLSLTHTVAYRLLLREGEVSCLGETALLIQQCQQAARPLRVCIHECV